MTIELVDLRRDEVESFVVHAAIEVAKVRIGIWWPGLPLPPTILFGRGNGLTRHGYRWGARARWGLDERIAGWTIEDEVPREFGGRTSPKYARESGIGNAITAILKHDEAFDPAPGDDERIEHAIRLLVGAFREQEGTA